jgi:hypothetical protein
MIATTRRRRTAAALAGPLLLLGGLTACGQDDSTPVTSGSDNMMQRQSQTQSDQDGRRSSEGREFQRQLDDWCQELLGDRFWPGLETQERTAVMRTMHRRMRSRWDDSALRMMSAEEMPGPSMMTSMMTRSCRTVR